MRFEMNIGLDVAGGSNIGADRARRIRLAEFLVRRGADWVDSVKRVGGINSVEEPCLYVRGRIGNATFLDQLCFDLCRQLKQDCIAIVDLDSGKGELIGPNAAAWGEFNPEYFRRPEKVAVAA